MVGITFQKQGRIKKATKALTKNNLLRDGVYDVNPYYVYKSS
jgi:hypothetical protein